MDGGQRVYRLVQCERGAGMQTIVTDAFLRHGNGIYRLSFEARAACGAQVPLEVRFLSNEKRTAEKFVVSNDGLWHRYDADVALDFDLSVTELLSVFFRVGAPCDELSFRNISLAKLSSSGASDVPKIKVALYLDNGCRGGGVIHLAQLLKSSPEVVCDFLDATDVLSGRLVGYDVLVMPGGSGYDRYPQLGEEGFEKIRRYIREGGCYYGICAGIALALNDPKRLRLIPYTREKTPPRGGFSAAVKFNARAEELLGVKEGIRYFRYHDGPIPAKGEPVPDSEYEVLATFESHVMQKGKSLTPMYGMPAVIYGRYGKGKVLVSVMHPEYFPSTHDVLAAGFKPLVGRTITFAYPKKSARPLRVAYYASEIDRAGDARATVKDAVALAERPDVDVTFVSGEQIAEGALDHADVLLIPGGRRDKMWQAARPLIDTFESQGRRIVESGRELLLKNESIR